MATSWLLEPFLHQVSNKRIFFQNKILAEWFNVEWSFITVTDDDMSFMVICHKDELFEV